MLSSDRSETVTVAIVVGRIPVAQRGLEVDGRGVEGDRTVHIERAYERGTLRVVGARVENAADHLLQVGPLQNDTRVRAMDVLMPQPLGNGALEIGEQAALRVDGVTVTVCDHPEGACGGQFPDSLLETHVVYTH